jgi:hypothetical protein|tara:strand:- start:147 stop:314 length:168 start_codon:yes stop_codon:yes gene_type:complete
MTKFRILVKFKNGQLAETFRHTEKGMERAVEQCREDADVLGVNVFKETCIVRDFA